MNNFNKTQDQVITVRFFNTCEISKLELDYLFDKKYSCNSDLFIIYKNKPQIYKLFVVCLILLTYL